MEALLIQALGTHKRGNRMEMRFGLAERWQQVPLDERETYLERAARRARNKKAVPFESQSAFRAAVTSTPMPSSARGSRRA